MKKKLFFFAISFVLQGLFFETALCQPDQNLFQQKDDLDTLNKALSQLYNFQFSDARTTTTFLRNKYKEHPAIQIFDCLNIYWENFPLSYHPVQEKAYTAALEKSKDKIKDFLKEKEDNPERIFYYLFINVLLAREYAAEDRSTKAATTALEAYKYIKKGFSLKEKFPEFYFSTGLYNYYREFLPAQSKLYKLLAWTFRFPQGNKVQGLAYLDRSTYSTVYVKPESLLITSAIYVKYENNKPKALEYAKKLHDTYPNNPFFTVSYIENLVQNNQYTSASSEIISITPAAKSSAYLQLSIALFQGMTAENYYRNDADALKYYTYVVKNKPNWDTQNYIGLAYYGLGNIAKRKGDNDNEEKYYEKANEMCEYLSIKKETDDY